MVADLFNTVYRPLVLFLRLFPPGCVRVVVDLFITVHYLLVLLLLYSMYSNVFVSHLDVSTWWRTYLTRCIARWYCFYVSFPRMCLRGGGPIYHGAALPAGIVATVHYVQ